MFSQTNVSYNFIVIDPIKLLLKTETETHNPKITGSSPVFATKINWTYYI